MNSIFFLRIGSTVSGKFPYIKWENTSAISSDAVDREYSVIKPAVLEYVSNPIFLVHVEHSAYLNSLGLKLDQVFSSNIFLKVSFIIWNTSWCITLSKYFSLKFISNTKVLFLLSGIPPVLMFEINKPSQNTTYFKSIFLRRDKKLNIPFRKSIKNKIYYIRENYGWCDDIDYKNYNHFELVTFIFNFVINI